MYDKNIWQFMIILQFHEYMPKQYLIKSNSKEIKNVGYILNNIVFPQISTIWYWYYIYTSQIYANMYIYPGFACSASKNYISIAILELHS